MTGMLIRDPVCGMEFSPGRAAAITRWKDETYYFCCQVCRAAFEEDPRRFTGPEKKEV